MESGCMGCFPGALQRAMNLMETTYNAKEYAKEKNVNVQIVEATGNTFAFYEEGDPAIQDREPVDRISKYQ